MGREDPGAKPLAAPLLTDENVHADVVRALRALGKDVGTVVEIALGGRSDREVIRSAFSSGRVVVTHDADFGTLAIRDAEPIVGIAYLRPGHIHAEFVMEMIVAIEAAAIEVTPPFVVVAERRVSDVRIRVRRLQDA